MRIYFAVISIVAFVLTMAIAANSENSMSILSDHKVLLRYENGTMLAANGKYDEAIQYLDKVIDSYPDFVGGWTFKGKALTGKGEYDEAMQCFNNAIELSPDYEVAWEGKGIVLFKQKKLNESIQCFDQAIEVGPQIAEGAFYYKNEILYQQGKYNEMLQCCKKSLALHPRQSSIWDYEGLAYAKLGKLVSRQLSSVG